MTTEPIATRVAILVGKITAQDLDLAADEGRSLRDLGVSSLGMIELIEGLEVEFGFPIEDSEIDEENFGVFAGLVRFVERRVGS